jgi:hypothetical protein
MVSNVGLIHPMVNFDTMKKFASLTHLIKLVILWKRVASSLEIYPRSCPRDLPVLCVSHDLRAVFIVYNFLITLHL